MEETPIIRAEEIHLFKIDIVENRIDAKGFKESENSKFSIGHAMMHNLKDEKVKMEVAFSFKNDKDIENIFFQMDFHFHIEKMDKFYKLNKDENPIFYGLMIATLLGISLSTARGIIFEKLESNGISNVIIPVVSPQNMMAQSKNK